MDYKEFKVLVEDTERIRATKPSGVTISGEVKMDLLKESMLKIFNSWLAEGKIGKRTELEVLGSYLYTVLFNGDIDEGFKKTCEEIRLQNDVALRVVLEFEPKARELATLPWEYLHFPKTDREKGFFIAARNKLILTRHVPLKVAIEKLEPDEKPLRILIVVCQPEGMDRIEAVPDIIETIKKLQDKMPENIRLERLDQPTKKSFHTKMKDFGPHVLHFIGYGKSDGQTGQLGFVNEGDDTVRWISDVDLADPFEEFQPRLIFLHTCEGVKNESGVKSEAYEGFKQLALELVYSNIPAVVAMQYPIEKEIAVQFTEKFYECLGEGKPIDVAVQEGRLELGMYLEEQNFSSRAFGCPVVYLQSAKGIIIAEVSPNPVELSPSDESLESLVRCPNRKCTGKVLPSDKKCADCRHELMKCPRCRKVMSKTSGICVECGYELGVDQEIEPEMIRGNLTSPTTTRGTINPPLPMKEFKHPGIGQKSKS